MLLNHTNQKSLRGGSGVCFWNSSEDQP